MVLVMRNLLTDAGDARDVVRSLGGNGTHSRILAWKTPWTEELGGLQIDLLTVNLVSGC